jgi:hypothetical protein
MPRSHLEHRDEDPSEDTRGRLGVTVAYCAASIAVYGLIITWLYGWRVFDNGLIINMPNDDWAQEVWFLGWPVYALGHGLNPFYSTWINYPVGVNLMANTSMPLLGIVLAPVTLLFGPVATYGVALRLGFLTSALSAQWVARRLGISRASSVAAGLLYGFSVNQVIYGNGHVFLLFAPLPPLIFYVVYRATTGAMSPRKAGPILGVLVSAQVLISLEVAALTVIACACGLAAAAALMWRRVDRARLRGLSESLGWSAGVATVLLWFPIASLFGRGYVSGTAHKNMDLLHTDVASLVVPGRFTKFSPIGIHLPTTAAYSNVNGTYLGVFLLAVLVVTVVKGWQVPTVRVAAITLVMLVVLSFGTQLTVATHFTGLPLPFAIFSHLPLLDNITPGRMAIPMYFVAAILAAWGMDRAIAWGFGKQAVRAGNSKLHAGVVAGAVALVALSLVPSGPYPTSQTNVPRWLASADGVRDVRTGSVVLFYPYPSPSEIHAMLVQAVDGYRYKIIGGQAIVEEKKGTGHAIQPLAPAPLPIVFLDAYELQSPARQDAWSRLPPMSASTQLAFHEFVRTNKVTAIVVEDVGRPGTALVLRYLIAAFGAPQLEDTGTLAFWSAAVLDAH